MNTPNTLLRLAGLALLTLAAAACNSAPKLEAKNSATLLKEIKAEIGDAACDGPQQCRSIAVGHKSCGGPEAYLAWSTKRNGEGRELNELVVRHRELRRVEDVKSGMVSNCMYLMDPGAICVRGHCALGEGSIDR